MKENFDRSSWESAFTRLELLAVLATITLLAVVAFPTLASNKSRSEQVSCLSNLRQVGHAIHLWGNDHGDRTPWLTPLGEGGTREAGGTGNPLRGNVYYQFGALSNELVTPRMLVCPSDVGVGGARRMASNFSSSDPSGGFFTTGYRNASLSYLVGLHAWFWFPGTVLSGDRNIRWDGINTTCTLGLSTALLSQAFQSGQGSQADVFWTNSIHGTAGNLLFMDGAVQQSSIADLQRAMAIPYEGQDCTKHFLAP